MTGYIQNNPTLALVVMAALYAVSLAAGFYLHWLGKPLNTPVFTLHKLAAVGFTAASADSAWLAINAA